MQFTTGLGVDCIGGGVRSRAAIGREVGYPKSTVAERIRAMLAAGELSEGEGEGEEPTN